MKSILLPTLLGAIALIGDHASAAPASLLDLTGAKRAASRLAESVVIVIDAQREYVDGRLPLTGVVGALQETHRLLQRARAAGVPVIHIQQISPPGRGVFDPTGPFAAIAAEASPAPGETVITKSLPNAFAGTTLDATLRRIGRKELIVAGYMTHMCVSATVRAALDHGYHSTVVTSACATRDLPDGFGGTLSAATVQRVAIAELADRFASVVLNVDAIAD